MNEEESYSVIDSLPTNPLNSNSLASNNSFDISNSKREEIMQQSLEFPEEYSQTPQNLTIDTQSVQSNHNIAEEHKKHHNNVRFNEEKNYEYEPPRQQTRNIKTSASMERIRNSILDDPIIYVSVLSGLVYFLLENPIIKSKIIAILSSYIIISNVDGSLNILGKMIMSIMFSSIVYTIYRAIDIGSFNVVLC